MSKELIRLRDLCMAYDDELVLDHLNLYINDKEFLTLLGPSVVLLPHPLGPNSVRNSLSLIYRFK